MTTINRIAGILLITSFGFSETRWNPAEQRMEEAPPGATLRANPYSGKMEYASDKSILKWDGSKYSYANEGEIKRLNPYSGSYEYAREDAQLKQLPDGRMVYER